MKNLKNVISLLTLSLWVVSMVHAEDFTFSLANESYSNESVKNVEEGSGTDYKFIEKSGGITIGTSIQKSIPCYAFIELNLDEVRQSVGTNISSANLQVYFYSNVDTIQMLFGKSDFTVYGVSDSKNLTGDVVTDWNAGNIEKSDEVLYHTSTVVANDFVEVDITNYISGLLQDDTITYAGIAMGQSTGYITQIYGNSTGEDAIYNPKFVVSTTSVPEPSTYAAIFGALALGFAIYRRRK